MAIETIINFDNENNFTFDNSKIVFENGKAQHRDLRPEGAILSHSFDDLVEDWGRSSFAAVLTNASLENGAIALTAGKKSYATMSGGLSGFGNKGSILARINFGFVGLPSSTLRVFRALNVNDASNLIELLIDTSGVWRVNLKDSFGNSLANSVAVGNFAISATKEYEVLWVFDTVLGYHRLFVDGVASATTLSYTYTRTGSEADIFQLGHNLNPAPHSAKFSQLTLFNSVFATGGYSAFQEISKTVYAGGYTPVTNKSPFLTDSILSFDYATDPQDVFIVVNVGNVKKYFDGVAWVNSTTPSQSNTPEDIKLNIASLDISNGENITFTVYLFSAGLTKSSVTMLYASYDFDFVAKTPNRCMVYGAVIGASGAPVQGATVDLLGDDFLKGETVIVNSASARSDASGQFELSTFETETTNTPVTIKISYKIGKEVKTFTFKNRIIPNADSVPISDLPIAL